MCPFAWTAFTHSLSHAAAQPLSHSFAHSLTLYLHKDTFNAMSANAPLCSCYIVSSPPTRTRTPRIARAPATQCPTLPRHTPVSPPHPSAMTPAYCVASFADDRALVACARGLVDQHLLPYPSSVIALVASALRAVAEEHNAPPLWPAV